jgi:hypothetical protein
VVGPTAGPTVAGVSVRPAPPSEDPPSVLGLATTGADIVTMTAAGAASLGAGTLVHRAGTRRRKDEGREPEEVGTSWEEP